MRTGDTVTAGGRTWTLGQRLGAGLWGATWEAFDAEGKRHVVKLPVDAADLPGDARLPDDLDALITRASVEAARALSTGSAFAPRIEAVLDLPGGRKGLVMPRYDTLRARMDAGMAVRDAVGALVRVAALLESSKLTHGNLRPSNVLLDERGQPRLVDVATPAQAELAAIVGPLLPDRVPYTPPEGGPISPRHDTWALCQALHEAVLAGDGRGHVARPNGLDKVALAGVKDRALSRLTGTGANPRFAPRFADNLGKLLNRGLSAETSPSPPYRFNTVREVGTRLEEVAALASPGVTGVGRLILSPDAKQGTFEGGATVRFSVSVDPTTGVGVDDVVCGVKVVDLDAEDDGRVRIHDTEVTPSAHPSGRLRFDLALPDLPPGRYEATVAFGVKDGHAPPTTSTGRFEVRPPPGYVPPAVDPPKSPAQALEFPTEQVIATEPGTDAITSVDDVSDAGDPSSIGMSRVVPLGVSPGAAPPTAPPAPLRDDEPYSTPDPLGPDAALFPKPLAPSSPGIAPPDPVPVELELDVTASIEADDRSLPTARDSSDREVLTSSPTVPEASPPPQPAPLNLAPSFDDVPGVGRQTDLGDLGDDLPGYDVEDLEPHSSGPAAWFEQAIEWVRRDTYTAFMVVIVVALTGLLAAIVTAKACG